MEHTIKACTRCGNRLEPGSRNALCPSCYAAAVSKPNMSAHKCRQCGADFTGGPRAWYCPTCRLDRKRKRDLATKRDGPARPIGSTDICKRCGKEYTVNGGLQKYCPDCAAVGTYETVKARKLETVTAYRKDNGRKRADKICKVCGTIFKSITPVATCSPQCAQKLRQINQKKYDSARKQRRQP